MLGLAADPNLIGRPASRLRLPDKAGLLQQTDAAIDKVFALAMQVEVSNVVASRIVNSR